MFVILLIIHPGNFGVVDETPSVRLEVRQAVTSFTALQVKVGHLETPI